MDTRRCGKCGREIKGENACAFCAAGIAPPSGPPQPQRESHSRRLAAIVLILIGFCAEPPRADMLLKGPPSP